MSYYTGLMVVIIEAILIGNRLSFVVFTVLIHQFDIFQQAAN